MIKKFWILTLLFVFSGIASWAMLNKDIQGCTDLNACNYDPDATEDDGSCTYSNTYYSDSDGDGFGDSNAAIEDCSQPTGYVLDNMDCDDADPSVSPLGIESCNNLDDNCDGEIDEFVVLTFYADVDLDGFGDINDAVFACTVPVDYVANSDDCDDSMITYVDADGDGEGSQDWTACGVYNSLDCDDNDAAINGSAQEICGDNIDQDCSGADSNCPVPGCTDILACNYFSDATVEDGSCTYPMDFFSDIDGDGFGDNNNVISACSSPVGYVSNDTDCNDNEIWYLDADGDGFGGELWDGCGVTNNMDCNDQDALISPDGIEVCNETDDDCDLEIDEFVLVEFYADSDSDGFGDANNTTFACSAPAGFVANAEDCDDALVTYFDNDQDGVGTGIAEACGTSIYNTDCDDNNAELLPGNVEICNGIDDNCDWIADEGATSDLYQDNDGDGFGNAAVAVVGCPSLTIGYVLDDTDCDDNNITFNDADGDGWGAGDAVACGTSGSNEDCDDSNSAIYPTANEICNEVDDNCDTQVDETVLTAFFVDNDGDGFGSMDSMQWSCISIEGFVSNFEDCDDNQVTYLDEDADGFGVGDAIACGTSSNNTDCDDAQSAIFPGSTETCNLIDDNCNIEIDEFVQNTYYADADGDGFGNANVTVFACDLVAGYVSNADDCDDTQLTYLDTDADGFGIGFPVACGTSINNLDCDDNNSAISPSAAEICNQIDDNCNIEIDEFVLNTYYLDADLDGFGDVAVTAYACDQPAGYVVNGEDCDDTQILYEDVDGDGFGNSNIVACGVNNNLDCNDNIGTINPGLNEVCGNAVDENCDGNINENCPVDMDGDGFDNIVDCDDSNPSVNPDATEICNGLDDNCNNGIDENLLFTVYFFDQDFDNYGALVYDTLCYNPGIGYAIQDADCNDDDANVNPGMVEVFNYIDDNCNSIIDDDFVDTDLDGIEDGTDTDDDNDGLLDVIEDDFNGDGITGDDCDGDGKPNTLDADDCEVFIPEGFSPNGDGVNDVFELQQLPYAAVVDLEVYNRWGGLVYESDDYKNDWNGTNIDGQVLPAGSYIYVVRIANKSLEYTQNLTIWR